MQFIKLFSILIIITFPLFSFSQQTDCNCHERLKNLAKYHYELGQNKEGLSAIKKAIEYGGENTSRLDYIILSKLYSKNDSLEQTYQSVLKGIEKGLTSKDLEADFFSSVKIKLGKTYWEKILKAYDRHHLIYLSSLNLEYRLSIEWLKGSDQMVRTNESTMENLKLIDSINFSKLLKLFDEYGFPTIKKHGFNLQKIDAFMLHHSIKSLTNLEEVVNILEDASSKCQCEKGLIPVIKDRYSRWGSQTNQNFGAWNLWTDKGVFGTIDNISDVDKRRMKYNLLRLFEQSKLEGRKLPADYQPIPYPQNYFCGFQFSEEKKE